VRVTLAQFAGVRAGLSEELALGDVLRNEAIDASAWGAALMLWNERLTHETQIAVRYRAAIAEAHHRYPRPVPPYDNDAGLWLYFARQWSAERDPHRLLARVGLRASDVVRLERLWSARLAQHPDLARRPSGAFGVGGELPVARPGATTMIPGVAIAGDLAVEIPMDAEATAMPSPTPFGPALPFASAREPVVMHAPQAAAHDPLNETAPAAPSPIGAPPLPFRGGPSSLAHARSQPPPAREDLGDTAAPQASPLGRTLPFAQKAPPPPPPPPLPLPPQSSSRVASFPPPPPPSFPAPPAAMHRPPPRGFAPQPPVATPSRAPSVVPPPVDHEDGSAKTMAFGIDSLEPPSLTLEQHASLTAELETRPADEAQILARYGLTSDSKRSVDLYWQFKSASDPAAKNAWDRARAIYAAWLTTRR
jgi:hypothetical protein